MKITLHELNNICHNQLGKENYQRYLQDILTLISFFSNQEITFNKLISERDAIIDINLKKLLRSLNKVVKGIPISRITGRIWWDGMNVFVNKHVFIPRIETILLIEIAEKIINQHSLSNLACLDLCCGTGCISLALKKRFPQIKCILTDISRRALNNAKKNAIFYGFKFDYIHSNFLNAVIKQKINIDLMMVNPPYLERETGYKLLNKYDPKRALYAKNNGNYFYEKLFNELNLLVTLPKIIILEINPLQKQTIINLFEKSNLPYKLEIFSDCYEKSRAISLVHI